MVISKGVTEPFAIIFDRLDQVGWNDLPQSQRNVLAVRNLIDEVNNGGFEQYFYNSSGDHWPDALAGLEAIGAKQTIELARQAIALFGQAGPNTERSKRQQQLAKIVENQAEAFSPLEETFYEDQEDIEVLLLLYMADHEAELR